MDELKRIYAKSEDVVEREIDGEIIIVPVTSGIGDLEEELFSLNDVGKDIWVRLDGKKDVAKIIEELFEIYEGEKGTITADVLAFLEELKKRNIINEVQIE